MRCPACHNQVASFFRYAVMHIGPIWKDRQIACANCQAMLRPKGTLERAGINLEGLVVGILVAVLVVAFVPLDRPMRTIVAVAVAVSVSLLVGHRTVRYGFMEGYARPRRRTSGTSRDKGH